MPDAFLTTRGGNRRECVRKGERAALGTRKTLRQDEKHLPYTKSSGSYLVKLEPGRLCKLVSVCVHQREGRPGQQQSAREGPETDLSNGHSFHALFFFLAHL